MKREPLNAIVLGCLTLMIGPSPAIAGQTKAAEPRSESGLREIRKVGAMLGTDVLNATNEKIASVKDLILDPDGTILHAILGHGGVAGVGTKYVAVPWERLNVTFAGGKWGVNLGLSKDALEKAPALESDDYRELANAEWMAKNRAYFTPAEAKTEAGSPRVVSTVVLASKLNDAKLRNARNEDLGEVEDLLLDQKHRVAYAIIGRGGVLGIGESFVPVPWSKLGLEYGRETKTLTATIDATKQKLERAPLVKEDCATLLGAGFAEQVDRYFGATRAADSSR